MPGRGTKLAVPTNRIFRYPLSYRIVAHSNRDEAASLRPVRQPIPALVLSPSLCRIVCFSFSRGLRLGRGGA
jgi:hypothetical protein